MWWDDTLFQEVARAPSTGFIRKKQCGILKNPKEETSLEVIGNLQRWKVARREKVANRSQGAKYVDNWSGKKVTEQNLARKPVIKNWLQISKDRYERVCWRSRYMLRDHTQSYLDNTGWQKSAENRYCFQISANQSEALARSNCTWDVRLLFSIISRCTGSYQAIVALSSGGNSSPDMYCKPIVSIPLPAYIDYIKSILLVSEEKYLALIATCRNANSRLKITCEFKNFRYWKACKWYLTRNRTYKSTGIKYSIILPRKHRVRYKNHHSLSLFSGLVSRLLSPDGNSTVWMTTLDVSIMVDKNFAKQRETATFNESSFTTWGTLRCEQNISLF